MTKTFLHIKKAKAKRKGEPLWGLLNPPDAKQIKVWLKRRWRANQKRKVRRGEYSLLDDNYEDTERFFY